MRHHAKNALEAALTKGDGLDRCCNGTFLLKTDLHAVVPFYGRRNQRYEASSDLPDPFCPDGGVVSEAL
jgi:hypothetical protein